MKVRLAAFIALLVGVVALLVLYYAPHTMQKDVSNTQTLSTRTLRVGATTITAEIAVSESEQEQGLSGRTSLEKGKGMLFEFDKDMQQGVWMKGMLFPIDILFLAQDGEVLSVNSAVSPDTYPEIFYPPVPARYVLELPAGYAKSQGIATGTKFVI